MNTVQIECFLSVFEHLNFSHASEALKISQPAVSHQIQTLEEQPDLTDPENPVTSVADGSIDFNHVNFSYKRGSGKNALSDIDLHIRSGETIGVIGGTGSGKSSLVNVPPTI